MMTSASRRKFPRFGLVCIAIAGVSLLSGCSSFDPRWKAAGETFPAAPRALEGHWQGNWVSDGDGHQGGLRCIITHKQSDIYVASFHATFWNLFQFSYAFDLKASQVSPTRYQFSGDSDLGWIAGGNYHYDGFAQVAGDPQTDVFACTYRSSADYGRFNMTRSAPANVAPASSQSDR